MAVHFVSMEPRVRPRRYVGVASLAASLALLLLPFLFRLDGKPHADWEQFLGRFHPLVIHLPIGLLVLLPVLEILGRRRPSLREAAELVLALSLVGCASAVALGYLLAYGGGSAGAGVTRHLWGGIALTLGVLACVWMRPLWLAAVATAFPGTPATASASTARKAARRAYPVLLGGVLLLLCWTAHEGGSLTHGDNYLFEFLPAPLKRLPFLGPRAANSALAPNSFYARHIHPILDANCIACHGESKVRGGLRMDTFALLIKGGDTGPAVLAGQPEKSLLLQRITLPTDHKNFMPAEGKPPLQPRQIAMIRAWIQQGASPTATVVAGFAEPNTADNLPLPQIEDYTARLPQIAQLARSLGVTLTPVSRNLNDGLVLQTIDVAPTFGDAQLAQLLPFAPYIVEAELGRTAVTDACFDSLARFTHLRALHLESTAVTGDGLAKLSSLKELTYLNLSETKVTQASIAQLSGMVHLRHVYLFNTPAQPIPPATPEPATPEPATHDQPAARKTS